MKKDKDNQGIIKFGCVWNDIDRRKIIWYHL